MTRTRNIQNINFNDGSRYFGEIDDGMKNGIGMLLVQDGSVYMGEWLNDNYHGSGVYIYPDG